MLALDVVAGEKVRTITADGHQVCSEAYHVYHHENEDFAAIAIEIDPGDEGTTTMIKVSPNHLVFVGDSFESRRSVRAKDIVPGDSLVSSSSSSGKKTVRAVHSIEVKDLVNILTYEPALVVHGDIVVSAYSYHETAYHYFFALPLRFWYNLFGANHLKQAATYMPKPMVDAVVGWEDNLKPFAYAFMNSF